MSINNRVVPSNSAVAAERRAFFVLTDATDLITPEDITVTGVKVSLSLNGATPANSTNDIVKVSGATGLYYLELTQTEANQTPGAKYVGTLQPSGCARAFVGFEIGAAGAFAESLSVGDLRDDALDLIANLVNGADSLTMKDSANADYVIGVTRASRQAIATTTPPE
jgi:hypothetical protein